MSSIISGHISYRARSHKSNTNRAIQWPKALLLLAAHENVVCMRVCRHPAAKECNLCVCVRQRKREREREVKQRVARAAATARTFDFEAAGDLFSTAQRPTDRYRETS